MKSYYALKFCLLVAMTLCGVATAQTRGPEPFAAGFLTFPVSGYAKLSGGGAQIGGGLSGGVRTPLPKSRNSFTVFEGYALFNPTDLAYLEERLNAEATGGTWVHYGALGGFRVISPINDALSSHLYGEIAGGLNISTMADISIDDGSQSATLSTSTGYSPAISFGLGFRERRVSFGGRYLHLGTPEYDLQFRTHTTGLTDKAKTKQRIQMFAAVIAVHF